jgi:hypothetical protein
LKVSKLGPSFENFKTVPVLRQAGTVLKTKKNTVRDGFFYFYFQKSSFENKNKTRQGTA